MSYKRNTISILVFSAVFVNVASCQPGTANLTPEIKVKLVEQHLTPITKFKERLSVNVPEGYHAKIFYAGRLSKARFMCWGPDSILYVANMSSGEVLALPDRNHDQVADTAIIAAKDAYGHDVKFFKGAMYVAEEKKVLKFTDENKDGIYETKSTFIDNILEGKKLLPGGHTTRTIVFDETRGKVYLSVGSSCNVCREEGRAVIFEYDLQGQNKKIYASGTRNCVGMTLHPQTKKLWATNNGSDNQGNTIPPEWIDEVREGGFYGFPFAYGHQVYFDFHAAGDYKKLLPITKADSTLVKKMKAPAALVAAHSAPMAIQFSNNSFTSGFRNGAFVAYRGSWDRHPPTGYKVVYLHFDKNNKVTGVSDVITGFLKEGEERPWARPVGLAADLRGNLYMSSDDIKEFILVLSKDK